MSQKKEYQEEFEKQREEYAQRLPVTVTEIGEMWHKLCNVGWDEDALSELKIAVHKLAGTGRNYGFKQVTRHALILDKVFKKIDKAGSVPSEIDKQLIETKLSELKLASTEQDDDSETLELPEHSATNSDLIYIVDDDEDASRYFDVILKSAGYKTKVFLRLDEFHKTLSEKVPDLIIMDIVFPEGHLAGIDAINRVESELGKSIPIIFISVRSDVVARIRALRAGGCAYITKPVMPETLLSVVLDNSSAEQRKKRILLIDDDPCTITFCETLLTKNNYEVLSTEDPLQMLHAIESFQPDAVVVDYNMPRCNGEELIKLLRMDHRYIHLPMIMVTADTSPEILEKIDLLCNTSFHAKPIDSKGLLSTIEESIEASGRSQKRMLDVLKQHPRGLLNLNYFYSELESIIVTAENDEQPYTLLYCAIDDPVAIRERVGLRELDNLNKKISSHLLSLVGKNELISQLTEFVYLMLIRVDDQSRLKADIDSVKNKLIREVFTVDNVDVSVTASIGAISISPKINSVDEAVSIAETASITANQNGGNQSCIELSHKIEGSDSDQDIGRSFMEAFKGDSLKLQYQPIVNIDTSESVYEAYARFVAGDKIITPGQFMPYIEEYNLEYEFNKKIVSTAIKGIFKSAENLHETKLSVVVKIEPTRKTMSEFMGWFSDYIDENRVRIENRLLFGFRETWVLKNRDSFMGFMEEARQHNCGLVIEHAGLSVYAADLVRATEPQFVKLAPDFVERLLSDAQGDSVDILHKLQATDSCIVAGSVENADMFAQLMAMGIYQFQGYFVQQPTSELDFSVSQHYL